MAGWELFVSGRIVLLMIGRDTHFLEKIEGFHFKQDVGRPTWPRNREMKGRIKTNVTKVSASLKRAQKNMTKKIESKNINNF